MPSLDTVVTGIGPVKAHVRPVAAEIAARWVLYFIWGAPGRGTGDHARGLALDFMTYELGGGVNAPGPPRDWIGNQIAAYVLANRVRLNVAYIIWNRRIVSAKSGWKWRAYTGSNPHIDHVHVSFKASGTYQLPPEEDDMAAYGPQLLAAVKALGDAVKASDAQNQRRYESILFNVQQEDRRNDEEKARDAALRKQLDDAVDEIKAAVEAADNEGNPS